MGGEVYYLHGDHLGSTSLTTDASGAVVSEVRYQPYGAERWSNAVASPTEFGFTSQRNEASFGLMDYNARYYSPALGRFISPDTIVPEPGSSGGFNRYRYTRNNPLRYTDPSGHCEICEYFSRVGQDMVEIAQGSVEFVRVLTPDAVKVEVGGSIIADIPVVLDTLGIEPENVGGAVQFVVGKGEAAIFYTTPQVNTAPTDMVENSLGLIPFAAPSIEGGGSIGLVWSTNNLATERGLQDMAGPGIDVNPSLKGIDLILGMNTSPNTGWPPMNVRDNVNIFNPDTPQIITLDIGYYAGFPDSEADFTVIPTHTEDITEKTRSAIPAICSLVCP